MIRRIIKIMGIIVLLCLVAYMGACAYFNWFHDDSPPAENVPTADTARYAVSQHGRVFLLSNDITEYGVEPTRTWSIKGYWEKSAGDWQYRPDTLNLAEKTFGAVKITLRTPE